MTTTTRAGHTSAAPTRPLHTLAIIGGAGHVAAQRFHAGLLGGLLDDSPIAGDTDLPDVVHLGYGLGGADGHFTTQQTTDWLGRNARMLTAVDPTLVVAVCNTIQPTLHNALGSQWPLLDNIAVVRDAAMAGRKVWLASQGAYAQDLFPHPGDALAALAEEMILAGMNDSLDTGHVDRLIDHLTDIESAEDTGLMTGVVLACTDLSGYAPLLRERGLTVVDAVEELITATLTALTPTTAFEEAIR